MKYDELMKLIANRRSCRNYDPERDVSDTNLQKALEAARLAPSACNKQPWRFIVVRDPELRKMICEKGLLPGIRMNWLADAPVILVICSTEKVVTHWLAPILSGIQYQLIDVGIAGAQLNLALEALGLATCWIGWFNAKAVKRILGIPAALSPLALMPIGYEKEHAQPTPRLAMEEILRQDHWK